MPLDSLRTITPNYLAGLFDGEGCIDVQRNYVKLYPDRFYMRPRWRMCMAINAVELGYELQELFGGHLSFRQPTAATQSRSWSLEWLSRDDIQRINGIIGHYLILKREQAKLSVWWLENASGRQRNLAPGIVQAREVFVEELRAMKADPQRLSERAQERIASVMRQSDHGGNVVTLPETRKALG